MVATVGAVDEQKAVTALQTSLAAQPALRANTWLGGPTVAGVQIASVSSQDLGRAELYALPFLLLLLFFVFRGLRAAAVPLVGAVFAIAVTLGVMGLALVVVPLSIFALNLVIALGIGLSVDFSLLIISRFREEFGQGVSMDAALATVRRTAGHTVLFSSLTIAAALATLAVFPERFVYSMGIAGAIVVLAAGAFALLVLPAILTVFGERIAVGLLMPEASSTTQIANGRRWYAMATRVMRRPVIWGAAAVAGHRGPGLPVHPCRLHRCRCQRPTGQQLGRNGLHPGPDRVPDLLRGTRRCPDRLEQGDAGDARHLRHRGVPCAGRQGGAGLPAPGRVALGVQRGPDRRTPVADRPAGRRGHPGASRSRAGDGHRADRAHSSAFSTASSPTCRWSLG